jgi:hypothetical protein
MHDIAIYFVAFDSIPTYFAPHSLDYVGNLFFFLSPFGIRSWKYATPAALFTPNMNTIVSNNIPPYGHRPSRRRRNPPVFYISYRAHMLCGNP